MNITIDRTTAQDLGNTVRDITELAAQNGFDEAKLRAIEALTALQVEFESDVPEDLRKSVKTALDVFRGRALTALGTLERSGRTLVAIDASGGERGRKTLAFVERIAKGFRDLSGETVKRIVKAMQEVIPSDSLETPWDVDAKTPEFCAALQRHGVADEDAPGLAERAMRVVTAAAKELFWDAKKDDATPYPNLTAAFLRHAEELNDVPPETLRKTVELFVQMCELYELRSPDFNFDSKVADLADALRKEGVEAKEALRIAAKTVAAFVEIDKELQLLKELKQ